MISLPDNAPTWLDSGKLAELAALAGHADAEPIWPATSLRIARELGAPRWSIPTEWGGQALDRAVQLEGSEQIAAADLTTSFILSQREAAVRLILQANDSIRQRYLPALARESCSPRLACRLTTSGQHRAPSLRSGAGEKGYRLDGEVPWVTGADHADLIVIGGVLEDGKQILLLLSRSLPGLWVESPLSLAALMGSRTAKVRCDGVEVPSDHVLAGPGEHLVRSGGGLDTSCLALGLTRAAVAFMLQESERRPAVAPASQRLNDALQVKRQRLHELARSEADDENVLALRVNCTRLVLHHHPAALAVAKGTGFVLPHPGQTLVPAVTVFPRLVLSAAGGDGVAR